MKTYVLVALILVSSTVFGFQKDDKKSNDNLTVPTEGMVYSLPRTGVRIHVKAKQEKFFHGPYFQYAEALLGIKNAPSSDFERWTITDIQIETFSEPDPEQVHKAMGRAGAMLSLTESGVLAGINSDTPTAAENYAVSTFLGDTKTPEFPFLDLSLNPFYEMGDSASSRAFVTKSIEEKAQEAAHTVTKLRKRRFKSLANAYEEQLPDGRAYELMVEELDKLEEEYVGLFVGKSYTKSFEYSFDFIPGGSDVSGEVAFRFSENKGVLPKTDLSGKPIVVDLNKLDDLSSAQEKLKTSASAVAGQSGIFYRIPGKAEIKVLNGLNTMAIARTTIAQFGTVAPFPESLLDGSYRISFHPTTGAVKNVMEK
ncbi:DUF4831 family protein [uncultured Sunxiuqinia sp.]|uniref:DUF4831 family protein n=1 Tax=uncultured Sunxiuqinia sp. TaxID=1573825 RepID=UPI00260F9B80|nr:DUF4831 family protein [uncultured Sunxiuqinia sp.]